MRGGARAVRRALVDIASDTLPQPNSWSDTSLKASVLYRISSILLVLFAIGHTLGFRKVQPQWGVEALVAAMKSSHFDVNGFSRSYWDFYVGFGLFVSAFILFAAVLAWQFGGLSRDTLAALRGPRWAFAICFVVVTYLSWRYFFIVPIVFSLTITICLSAAASLSSKSAQSS